MFTASVSDDYCSTVTNIESSYPGSDAASTSSTSSLYSNHKDSESSTISRSASSLQLAPAIRPLDSRNIRRTFSARVLPTLENSFKHEPPPKYNPDSARGDVVSKLSRGLSVRSFRHSKIAISKFAITEQHDGDDAELEVEFKRSILKQEKDGRSSSDLHFSFAPTSSASILRPSTPNVERQANSINGTSSFSPVSTPEPTKGNPVKLPAKVTLGDSILEEKTPAPANKHRRPISSFIKSASIFTDKNTSAPPIPGTTSAKFLTPASRSNSQDTLTNPSRTTTSERLQDKKAESFSKKDELWSLFRILDGEHQRFVFHKLLRYIC